MTIQEFDDLLKAISNIQIIVDRMYLNARLNAGQDADEIQPQLDADKVEVDTAMNRLWESAKWSA